MFTSAECQAQAEDKLAQAECDPSHSRRLTAAAQGWLLLASQMRRLEAALKMRPKGCPRDDRRQGVAELKLTNEALAVFRGDSMRRGRYPPARAISPVRA